MLETAGRHGRGGLAAAGPGHLGGTQRGPGLHLFRGDVPGGPQQTEREARCKAPVPREEVERGEARPTEFLEQTCHKAGLPIDAWKMGATLEAFTAEVFGEEGAH